MKRLLFVSVLLLCLTLTACGKASSSEASLPESKKGNESENSIVEGTSSTENEDIKDEKNLTDEKDIIATAYKPGTAGYVSSFDLYAHYSPSPLVTNTVLSDGLYLQIGDTVLELGKSTLQDFMNAGVDLYDSKASYGDYFGHPYRDQDLNKKRLQEYIKRYTPSEKGVYRGFISGDIRIEMSDMNRHLTDEKTETPIIDSVIIENYAGDTGNPSVYLYGESDYRDINSIYITGGIRFTGPVSSIADNFGKIDYEHKGEEKGYPTWTRVFTEGIEETSYQYFCQVLSRADHCSQIYAKIDNK